MTDFLFILYPWIKAFHIMAVISWMAGLFYLPRLFVHHTEQVKTGSETDALFQMMETKLLRVIMTPAMVVTWMCGIVMVVTPGIIEWSAIWPWAKLACVVAMSWFHFWLRERLGDFKVGENSLTGRQFRMMNEVPTVLMIIIVISVVVRPV